MHCLKNCIYIYCQCSTCRDCSVGSCTLIVSILCWLNGLPSGIVNELNDRGKSVLAMYSSTSFAGTDPFLLRESREYVEA